MGQMPDSLLNPLPIPGLPGQQPLIQQLLQIGDILPTGRIVAHVLQVEPGLLFPAAGGQDGVQDVLSGGLRFHVRVQVLPGLGGLDWRFELD